MFGYTHQQLKALGAEFTIPEIYQQVEVLQGMQAIIEERKEEIESFFRQIKHNQPLKIIFTGAGTSAFIGNILVRLLQDKNIIYTSVATTDLVSNPLSYFCKEEPTLLVSFARSGNSPESLAAVELGKELVDQFYQLNITCSASGQLAQQEKSDTIFTLLTPPEANDQSMAMTSSFTAMLYAGLAVFKREEEEQVQWLTQLAWMREEAADFVKSMNTKKIKRVVFIGSGAFEKLGEEAALKMLELTSGEVVALFDSSLGFRHGPKSFLNEETAVIFFLSNDSYTRQYDKDIIHEIAADPAKVQTYIFGQEIPKGLREVTTGVFELREKPSITDAGLLFPYILLAQLFAVESSIARGYFPDNPSPTGRINRVVKGVTIYPLK